MDIRCSPNTQGNLSKWLIKSYFFVNSGGNDSHMWGSLRVILGIKWLLLPWREH